MLDIYICLIVIASACVVTAVATTSIALILVQASIPRPVPPPMTSRYANRSPVAADRHSS